MSTVVPIQELDTSTDPPRNSTIHAVVTLLWPYSSSTRQCALLLSERDFRLRARGGQIRVKFSGPAARAVAEGKLGIGNEVVLELGSGQWVRDEVGVAVHVPGKSVGELQFGRGVRLRVQKEGAEDVEIDVAEDAVDETEQEQEREQEQEQEKANAQVMRTPAKRTSSTANFRSSIGSTPGNTAIYSSPAYMRRAAKFSYLDGLSRLFEDEWENQDLPRKKARTSIGEVKSWRVVDRTPSPERRSSASVAQVDQGMTEVEDVDSERPTGSHPVVEPSDSQAPAAEGASVISSPVFARAQTEPRVNSPSKSLESQLSPLEQLATSALEDQQSNKIQAPCAASAYPRLSLPSASPTPQPHEAEAVVGLPTDDPVTPRLLPLSSTALPSTTPQISPLATKLAFEAQSDAERTEEINNASQTVELPDVHAEVDVDTLATPKAATEDLLEQIQFAPSDTGSAAETRADDVNAETMTSEASRDVDALLQPNLIDLAEEDGFSDEEAEKDTFPDQEADETLSAHEHDDEIMQEDDDHDVFDAATLGGERMSDEDTTEDREMYEMRGHGRQWLDESTTEKDSDLEEQQPMQDELNGQAAVQPIPPRNTREASQQPGFAPASTLLHAAETPVKAPSVVTEKVVTTTPLAGPQLQADRTVTSIEATTPAAKTADTPKTTPQSARDKVMKRTFSSLFGIKGTPSPEKEDLVRSGDGTNDAVDLISQTKRDDGEQQTLESDRLQSSSEGNQQYAQIEEDTATVYNELSTSLAQDDHAQQEAATFASDMQPSLSAAAEHPPEQLEETSPPESPQVEDMLPEQQPAELINLDSDSEEDDQVEAAAPDQTPSKPEKLALVPQRRPSARPADVPVATRDEVEPASANAIYGSAEEVEASIPEPIVVKEPEMTGQHETSDAHQSSSPRSSPINDALVSKDEEHDATGQSELPAVSESIVQPDVLTADANELLPTSTFPESSAHVEPEHPSLAEYDFRESAQSESLGIFEGLEDIPGQVYDAEMQVDGPGSSLEKTKSTNILIPQEAMDMGDVAAAAALEQSHVDQGLDDANHSAEEDVEMLSNDPALREPSQASIQSQVAEDDVKVQDHGAREASSRRPVSRDTIEDFSPVVLGSMSHRIADIVSYESAAERLQELQSQEDAGAADEMDQEALRISSMTNMIDEVASESTPSCAEKHTEVIDILSSPLESFDFSPVRLTRSTQELVSTPQPGDTLEIKETAVTMESSAGLEEEEADNKEEGLGNQLQTPDNTAEQRLEPTRESLNEINMQTSLAGDPANVEEVAHITPSLSPSAIDGQTVGPDAGVSHANAAQAAMQPTPLDTQISSDQQPSPNHNSSKASEKSQMSQADHHEEQQIDVPPPEQEVPPKTPARKSFRSRLSNVPDVISAWFSPKRPSIAAQQSEKKPQVDKPAASTADAVQPDRTPKKHASGISTAHGYFTSLASLDQHLNPSSQQAGAVDVLAVVTDFTKDPERAKGGPRDYYTVFKITDQNMSANSDVRVEVFRPWKAVLPAADVGDVVLLRAFVVKSKKRQPFLLSTDTSGWCVWRFAEHSRAVRGPDRADGDRPVWARRMSHGDVREEVKGPPVEYGLLEKEEARKLREWWNDTHDEPQGEVSRESVGKNQEEDSHAIEL